MARRLRFDECLDRESLAAFYAQPGTRRRPDPTASWSGWYGGPPLSDSTPATDPDYWREKGQDFALRLKRKEAMKAKKRVLDFSERHLRAVPDDEPLEKGRRTRITWAIDIEPEPVTWVWNVDGEGRLPAGTLSIAGGREGTGKSSFGIWMAAQITRGKLPGAWHGRPRNVLYAAVEDSWKFTLVPRLMAAGADLSKVGRFDVIEQDDEEMVLSLPRDNAQLERDIAENDIALIVVDPITSVMSEDIDTHHVRQVRRALDPLAKIADRTGAVILGIAHFNKSNSTDVASLLSGSHAFRDVPRTTFGFVRDGETRLMTQVKNSLGRDDLASFTYQMKPHTVETKRGPADTAKFVFTGKTDRSVADVLKDSQHTEQDHTERDEAAEWLRAYMKEKGGKVSAAEAVREARDQQAISKTTLFRARKKAGVRTVKEGMTNGWVWTLDNEAL